MNLREQYEANERVLIGEHGFLSVNTKGREREEPEDELRTCFQRDTDRITHSKSFRRLMHKTQVFLQPEGDHYRTRLTHTFEVTRIARTISRALRLNEDLTEAISLGHDLGHTPFGHEGERSLNRLMADKGGFKHYTQSLRVVDKIEKNGRGLNLCYEVRNGIVCHTNSVADTLEGQVVRFADRIAYMNHDVDDAVRAGILEVSDIPSELSSVLGYSHGERINAMVADMIVNSSDGELKFSPAMYFVTESFHNFLYECVYKNPKAKSEESKVYGMLSCIFEYYIKNPNLLPDEFASIAEDDGIERAVCDYISGMTDKYAIDKFGKIFIPSAWSVR